MTIEKFKSQAIIAKHRKGCKLTPEMQKLHDEVVDWINNVEDCLVREILYQRYILGKSWVGVANSCGYLNGSECFRKMAERYLAKHLKKGGVE